MRRMTLAGIGLAAALAAVPAIALAQSPDPATTPVECPFHAAHAGLHQQMLGGAGTMMPGAGMQGMSGMHQQMGSMMGQMNSMMSPQG